MTELAITTGAAEIAYLVKYGEASARAAEEIAAQYPDLNFLTVAIMANDRVSALMASERLRSGEIPIERAVWLVGSYERMNWALLNCDRAWVLANICNLWRDSDPDDTDPRFLALWCEARASHRHYVRDGKLLLRQKLLRLWRGQELDAPLGLSWSLDWNVADRFARGAGVRSPLNQPVIMTATALRSDVLAYLTGRNEQEVIIDPKRLAGAQAW